MKLKNTIIIILIIIIGYFVLDYFKLVIHYWDIINLLPLPNNIKNIIAYIKKYKQLTESVTNTYNTVSNNKVGKLNRRVSQIKKKIVASNQKWKCKGCGILLDYSYEVDHIKPLYKGGSNEIVNLQALCRNCHGKKTISDGYI